MINTPSIPVLAPISPPVKRHGATEQFGVNVDGAHGAFSPGAFWIVVGVADFIAAGMIAFYQKRGWF